MINQQQLENVATKEILGRRQEANNEPPSIPWEESFTGEKVTTSKGLRAVPASDLLTRTITRPDPLIERILYPGLTVFHGRPKSGKSWLALQLTIALALGGKFARALAVRRAMRVCYLALEEPEWRTAYRLQQLLPDAVDELGGVAFIYEIDPLLAGGAAQLARHLTENPADVVVVDTYLAVMGMAGQRGGNVVQQDYNAWKTLLEIAHKFNVALIVIAHSRKGGGDITESLTTSTGAPAAVDCLWQLKRLADGKGEFEVLGRETEGEVFEMTFGGEEDNAFGWQITAEGSEVGLTAERAEIVELLRAEGSLKPARIASMLRKNAVTIRRLLQKLSFEDVVRRNSDGTYYATTQGVRP